MMVARNDADAIPPTVLSEPEGTLQAMADRKSASHGFQVIVT